MRAPVAIALFVVIAALFAAVLLSLQEDEAGQTDDHRRSGQPNVVVIMTDDQRQDTIRYMPHVRRLFHSEGVSFTNAFATTPVCCPSRASTLTGLYAHNHKVLTASSQTRRLAVLAQHSMLQKTLHEAGYATALYGKFLNSWDVQRDPRYLSDWSVFANSAPYGYRHGLWNVNGEVRRVDRYSTTFIREKARDFIKDQESSDRQPWFMYVAPAASHAPFEPEAAFRRASVPPMSKNPALTETDRGDKPDWVRSAQRHTDKSLRIRRAQIRTLQSVDVLVAGLVEILEDLDEDRSTLLIYTSDNGYLWGEHGLRGKRWPYLDSAKIPLYLRWPGRLRSGTDHRLVANIDVVPTIVDAVGLLPGDVDGRSLLSNGGRNRLLLEYFASESVRVPPDWASTITSSYQYIEYYDHSGTTMEREYFELGADPWQLTNLLGDPDVRNDLSSSDLRSLTIQLRRDRSCRGVACP